MVDSWVRKRGVDRQVVVVVGVHGGFVGGDASIAIMTSDPHRHGSGTATSSRAWESTQTPATTATVTTTATQQTHGKTPRARQAMLNRARLPPQERLPPQAMMHGESSGVDELLALTLVKEAAPEDAAPRLRLSNQRVGKSLMTSPQRRPSEKNCTRASCKTRGVNRHANGNPSSPTQHALAVSTASPPQRVLAVSTQLAVATAIGAPT